MTTKRYDIFLDDKIIGTTALENADPPMGVIFGHIRFLTSGKGYDFFKEYCINNAIEIVNHLPDEKFLSTRTIKNLIIRNEDGLEIVCLGNQISGMDNERFEITLEGVPYPLFEEEFPHHVKAYHNQFKEN